MSGHSPLISILTPTYQAARYLRGAIESVIAQDESSWEHIVVDGGSTDETVDLLKSYSHVRWISEPDRGQSDAMNRAFSMARGRYIMYLNADDWLLPGALRRIMDTFRGHPQAAMVIGDLTLRFPDRDVAITPGVELPDILEFEHCRWPINPVAYAYRREVQEAIGPFPVNEHYAMDYWFLLRAYFRFKVVKIPHVLGVFDMHGGNKTSGQDSLPRLAAIRDVFFEEHERSRLRWLWKAYKLWKGVDEYLRLPTVTNSRIRLRTWSVLARLIRRRQFPWAAAERLIGRTDLGPICLTGDAETKCGHAGSNVVDVRDAALSGT